MAQLTLSDLKLGFKELFDNREKQKLLSQTKVGAFYLPLLADKQKAIETLAPALTASGRPLADELSVEDDLHDGYGRSIWYITEAYLALPGLDTSLRDAMDRLRTKVLPSLKALKQPYPEEAAQAVEREKHLPEIKADAKKIPVAGGTLFDWVSAFTTHGLKLHDLLAERGNVTAGNIGTPTRRSAGVLRNETIGLLTRVRASLSDELAADATLPRNLDAHLFGYFDELLRIRAANEPIPSPAPPTGASTKP